MSELSKTKEKKLSEIQIKKAELRKILKQMRAGISKEKKHAADIEIISRLLMTKEYHNATIILCYFGIGSEIDTKPLIYAALANKKRVALPRCNGNEIDFYFIKNLDCLKEGKFGLYEPDPEKCRQVRDFKGSLLIAPGLSFSPNGDRIGYGKGYYDRFLSCYNGKTVGLCYHSMVKLNLPVEEADRKVDILITEKYTRNI